MSKLLINENPLVLLPSLAVLVGINQAIFLQQVNYWLQTSKHKFDGRKWTYNTVDEWLVQFPFFSKKTLERVISSLVEKEVLLVKKLSSNPRDRTNYYSIDIEKLELLSIPSRQNDGMDSVKMTECTSRQNDGMYTETTTETSSDIKKNSASESVEEKAQVEKLKQGQFAKPNTFQMTFDWKPSIDFEVRCKIAGKDFSRFNDGILLSFINYNESREQYKTQKEWEALLLTAFIRELGKPSVRPQSSPKPFEKSVTPENASSSSDFVATKKEAISEEEKARRKEFLSAQRQQNGEPA